MHDDPRYTKLHFALMNVLPYADEVSRAVIAAIDAPRPGAVPPAPSPAREFTEKDRSELATALYEAWSDSVGQPWHTAADAALAWFRKKGGAS